MEQQDILYSLLQKAGYNNVASLITTNDSNLFCYQIDGKFYICNECGLDLPLKMFTYPESAFVLLCYCSQDRHYKLLDADSYLLKKNDIIYVIDSETKKYKTLTEASYDRNVFFWLVSDDSLIVSFENCIETTQKTSFVVGMSNGYMFYKDEGEIESTSFLTKWNNIYFLELPKKIQEKKQVINENNGYFINNKNEIIYRSYPQTEYKETYFKIAQKENLYFVFLSEYNRSACWKGESGRLYVITGVSGICLAIDVENNKFYTVGNADQKMQISGGSSPWLLLNGDIIHLTEIQNSNNELVVASWWKEILLGHSPKMKNNRYIIASDGRSDSWYADYYVYDLECISNCEEEAISPTYSAYSLDSRSDFIEINDRGRHSGVFRLSDAKIIVPLIYDSVEIYEVDNNVYTIVHMLGGVGLYLNETLIIPPFCYQIYLGLDDNNHGFGYTKDTDDVFFEAWGDIKGLLNIRTGVIYQRQCDNLRRIVDDFYAAYEGDTVNVFHNNQFIFNANCSEVLNYTDNYFLLKKYEEKKYGLVCNCGLVSKLGEELIPIGEYFYEAKFSNNSKFTKFIVWPKNNCYTLESFSPMFCHANYVFLSINIPDNFSTISRDNICIAFKNELEELIFCDIEYNRYPSYPLIKEGKEGYDNLVIVCDQDEEKYEIFNIKKSTFYTHLFSELVYKVERNPKDNCYYLVQTNVIYEQDSSNGIEYGYENEDVYDNPYYNDNLDMDQQDPDFWP